MQIATENDVTSEICDVIHSLVTRALYTFGQTCTYVWWEHVAQEYFSFYVLFEFLGFLCIEISLWHPRDIGAATTLIKATLKGEPQQSWINSCCDYYSIFLTIFYKIMIMWLEYEVLVIFIPLRLLREFVFIGSAITGKCCIFHPTKFIFCCKTNIWRYTYSG